ncbi:MAG: PEGA domain-containing protein [Nitrososphaeria archaeon]
MIVNEIKPLTFLVTYRTNGGVRDERDVNVAYYNALIVTPVLRMRITGKTGETYKTNWIKITDPKTGRSVKYSDVTISKLTKDYNDEWKTHHYISFSLQKALGELGLSPPTEVEVSGDLIVDGKTYYPSGKLQILGERPAITRSIKITDVKLYDAEKFTTYYSVPDLSKNYGFSIEYEYTGYGGDKIVFRADKLKIGYDPVQKIPVNEFIQTLNSDKEKPEKSTVLSPVAYSGSIIASAMPIVIEAYFKDDPSVKSSYTLKAAIPKININSKPSGATVTIDGKLVGKTPITVELLPGTHVFEFELEGYLKKVEEVYIPPVAKEFILTVELVPKPKTLLKVDSSPQGARIYLNNKDTEKVTPCVFELNPGDYIVSVSLEGYKTESSFITVVEGKENTLFFELKKEAPQELPKELPKEAPKEAPKVEKAIININSKPLGAVIYVNNSYIGRMTPATIELDPGKYVISVELEGYNRAEKEISIEAGKEYDIIFELVKKEEKPEEIAVPKEITEMLPIFAVAFLILLFLAIIRR